MGPESYSYELEVFKKNKDNIQRMKATPKKWRQSQKNEDGLKNDDFLRCEDKLKNEENLKNIDNIKNED